MVSSLGYMVHGFKSTGYLVLRVRVQFRGNRVQVRSYSLPATWMVVHWWSKISILQSGKSKTAACFCCW